jgi:hypothetical protein
MPHFRMPLPANKALLKTRFIREINMDEMVENKKIAINNIFLNEHMLKKFHEKEADQVTTPFIMILGGKD